VMQRIDTRCAVDQSDDFTCPMSEVTSATPLVGVLWLHPSTFTTAKQSRTAVRHVPELSHSINKNVMLPLSASSMWLLAELLLGGSFPSSSLF